MSTKTTLRLAIVLVGASLAASGCLTAKSYHDDPGGLVAYDAGPGGPPDGAIRPNRPVLKGEIAPVYGFVGPQARVEYYYLGEVDRVGKSVPVNPIYFFYDENDQPLFQLSEDGEKLVGWHPVVNVVPTKHGYSPFWRVHRVRVKGKVDKATIAALKKVPLPKDSCQMDAICKEGERCIEDRCTAPIKVGVFDLDAIKSLDTLNDSKLVVRPTETVINCPIVDADAKLLKGLSNPDLAFPKIQLWYKRLKAFCYLVQGGKELLGAGAKAMAVDVQSSEVPIAEAYFLRRELSFGTNELQAIAPARNLVLTEQLPGDKAYSALVRENAVYVGKDHESKDLRSVAEIAQNKLKTQRFERLHNLAVRGLIPACKTDDDCKNTGGRVDPPLKCSVEQGYCSPPFARFGEECRRGVKECDPKGGPGGTRLACVGLRVRDKYFCFNACDSSKPDGNPDPDIDTRCGSSPTTQCFALRRTDPSRPNGVCIKKCNSRAGDQTALLNECVSPTCGDGKLDFGETCDDGNKVDGDGCNRYCSISTFVRCENQSDCKVSGTKCMHPCDVPGASCKVAPKPGDNLYCLPAKRLDPQGKVIDDKEKCETVEKNKFRPICMEFDYCWPPDERADWLGEKEEENLKCE